MVNSGKAEVVGDRDVFIVVVNVVVCCEVFLVRTGMFCRLGSLLLRRPVTATACA